MLAYLQYNCEPLTYTERVLRAKANDAFFQRYQDARARRFLHFILEQYEQHGIEELDTENLSHFLQRSAFRGNHREAIQVFGGNPALIQQAFLELQKHLFQS